MTTHRPTMSSFLRRRGGSRSALALLLAFVVAVVALLPHDDGSHQDDAMVMAGDHIGGAVDHDADQGHENGAICHLALGCLSALPSGDGASVPFGDITVRRAQSGTEALHGRQLAPDLKPPIG